MVTNIDHLNLLQNGKITLHGEFIWGSNYTFLAQVELEGDSVQAVYKPSRGERPLWDFPAASLARRETAAYLVSELLEWGLVPLTVYRKKGPLGPGSLQVFVDHDPDYHFFNFTKEDRQRLRPAVVFDWLINNADRKGSHILKSPDNRMWLIDHGVCFHVEDKLRTVIWDFVGEPVPMQLCKDIDLFAERLLDGSESHDQLFSHLSELLSRQEILALIQRANLIAAQGVFPAPDPHRRPFPWPQI